MTNKEGVVLAGASNEAETKIHTEVRTFEYLKVCQVSVCVFRKSIFFLSWNLFSICKNGS